MTITITDTWAVIHRTDNGPVLHLPNGTAVQLTGRHGTRRGYRIHRAAGEQPCPPCSDANSRYVRGWSAGRRTAARR